MFHHRKLFIMTTCLFFFGGTLIVSGCASNTETKIITKIQHMSDAELIDHSKMIEMRMVDIDRDRESNIEREAFLHGNDTRKEDYNHLGHMHIGDNWNRLKREQELTRLEMEKRGLLIQ
jgi:hypothetical protein